MLWLHATHNCQQGSLVTVAHCTGLCPGSFLGIVCQDFSDSKSNQLNVDIFQCCFIHLRYILQIPLK